MVCLAKIATENILMYSSYIYQETRLILRLKLSLWPIKIVLRFLCYCFFFSFLKYFLFNLIEES